MGFLKKNSSREIESAAGTVKQGLGWKEYLLYYLIYTVLFGVMAAAVFVWLYLRGRQSAGAADSVSQEYEGFLIFAKWGKEVLRVFRETGKLQFPAFTLHMGDGADLYTTLGQYVIGDPFSLPAVFAAEKDLAHFYDLMLPVRFWLAGITFSAYNFYMGRRNRIGILAGALIYIFNGFTLAGMQYHHFLNPFVFFPLLLIGCELYFRKRNPWLYLVMVFIAAVSNIRFFWMMAIMTLLYAVWRSIRIHRLSHFGAVILDGISFVWYGLIGTLLSSFILLPLVLRFLQDSETLDSGKIPFFWPLWYYQNFIDSFLSNGTSALSASWTYMGFGAAALLCVLFIFVQRGKHFDLKAAFAGLTLLLMTPLAGYVLNGFSYPANRWMWAYALLVGTMTAAAIPELAEAGWKKLTAGLVLFAAAIAVCAGWGYSFSRASAQSVILGLLGMAAVLIARIILLEKEREQFLSGKMLSGSAEAQGQENETSEERDDPAEKISLRVQAVLLVCVMLSIASASFFYFGPGASAEESEAVSGTQSGTDADIFSFDSNDALWDSVAITSDSGEEYEKLRTLPIAFTTNQWISRQDYDSMDLLQRQQALTQGILLEEDPGVEFTQMNPAAAGAAGAAGAAAAVTPLTDLDTHEMGGSTATEQITGHAELASPQILCVRIPRTAGWAAYVDGDRAEILQGDTLFSAILLPAGSHDIELRYQTPGLRFGAAISLVTLLVLVLFIVIYGIVTAVLHGRDKRLAAIPVGTFEAVKNAENKEKAAEEKRDGEEEKTIETVTGQKAEEPERK